MRVLGGAPSVPLPGRPSSRVGETQGPRGQPTQRTALLEGQTPVFWATQLAAPTETRKMRFMGWPRVMGGADLPGALSNL